MTARRDADVVRVSRRYAVATHGRVGVGAADPFERAWQDALAAEQQAVFGYALLGPRLDRTDADLARRDQQDHEDAATRTAAAITAAGSTPVAPLADYPALYPVPDAASARRLAVRLETTCAAAWRYLYAQAALGTGSAATARRAQAQAGLSASAVRATRWRAVAGIVPSTVPFPGL